jgi:hypothetical protein
MQMLGKVHFYCGKAAKKPLLGHQIALYRYYACPFIDFQWNQAWLQRIFDKVIVVLSQGFHSKCLSPKVLRRIAIPREKVRLFIQLSSDIRVHLTYSAAHGGWLQYCCKFSNRKTPTFWLSPRRKTAKARSHGILLDRIL